MTTDEASQRLGALVREYREAAGWSQETLAQVLSDQGLRWYQSTVNRVETGGRNVSWDEAIVLSAALEFDLGEAASIDLARARARYEESDIEIEIPREMFESMLALMERLRRQYGITRISANELRELLREGEG